MSVATNDDEVLPSTESVEALQRHVTAETVAGDIGAATKIHASIRCVATLQAAPDDLECVDARELRQRLLGHVHEAAAGERVQERESGVLLLIHAGVTNRLTDDEVSLLVAALVESLVSAVDAAPGAGLEEAAGGGHGGE